jgi:ankyrin repeat protein
MRAIAESDEDLVEDLIRHGAEVDVDTLNFAIRQSATPGILVILGTGNPDAVCGKARDGANPVRLLAAKGEVESLLALLRLTTQDQMIQVLVDAGANVNAVDDQHRTPLGQAVQSHNYRLTTALLESGANPDQQSYFGIDWLSR